MVKKVCLIGSGPSGMSVLYHLERLNHDKEIQIVCYERQEDWGGLWNYSWRSGLDDKGESVHGSMYRYLWSNGPKEASLEYPDFTWYEHLGKSIPSFPPREVLFHYLQGRWNKDNLRKYIKFNTKVTSVVYNPEKDDFSVIVKDLVLDKCYPAQRFDYVINATGHFSTPNVPSFPGIQQFPGRILHSHDFRDAKEFAGKRVLLVGASYSAEDLSMQCIKYGAASAITCYRKQPMGFKFPKGIVEKPLLTNIEGNKVTFKDGSTAEVDVIVLCTGYLNHYPWLEDSLRMNYPNTLYPPSLYKGTLWTEGGNNKMLYVGIQDQYYTYTMFDAQARWAIKCIQGKIDLPDRGTMLADNEKWISRFKTLKDCHEDIDFQTDFVQMLAKESDYGYDLDISDLFHAWEVDKATEISTYRDKSHKSKYSGKPTPVHHTPWFEAMDDSMESYMAVK